VVEALKLRPEADFARLSYKVEDERFLGTRRQSWIRHAISAYCPRLL
jgi:hypothetical protein